MYGSFYFLVRNGGHGITSSRDLNTRILAPSIMALQEQQWVYRAVPYPGLLELHSKELAPRLRLGVDPRVDHRMATIQLTKGGFGTASIITAVVIERAPACEYGPR